MLQAGQILQERYQLQHQLGRTAAGRQTWLSLDLQASEQVIVKLLAFSPQMQWEELKLFEREAQVLANLDHPRIPRYRDYFSLDQQTGAGLPWFGLVQEYIPGASLQQLLEEGKHFSEIQVKKIATQVLNILTYLHELSPPVLHRDIKPSNLIFVEDEQVYLVDFGAVQDRAAFTGVTFTVVGTSGYAPLEQFWGRAVPASDLYALGATLIHLLTGIAPVDLPHKDSRIQFANRVSINPSLVSWIENVTESAIEKRFTTAREALAGLESNRGLPSPATKPSATRKIPQPRGTRLKANKSAEKLEIHIPAGGIKLLGKYGCLSILGSFYFGTMLIALVAMIISSVPLLGLTLLTILVAGLAKFFGEKTHISFNHNRFKLVRQTFGLTYGLQEGHFAEILGVFLNSQGSVNAVSIRLGTNHTIRLGGALTETESMWLAQEIQDWLNIKSDLNSPLSGEMGKLEAPDEFAEPPYLV